MFLKPYRELGVRRVINACSTATHLGGSIVDPRVMDARKDAAGSVLPRSNLKKFAASGVTLIAVIGDKQIKGPNDTSILYGRKDPTEIAKLQDSPFNGLGGGMKVD